MEMPYVTLDDKRNKLNSSFRNSNLQDSANSDRKKSSLWIILYKLLMTKLNRILNEIICIRNH